MNNETVNQENNTAEEQERTFTQSEMNAIIQDRLSRERSKYADYDAIKEKASKYDEATEASKSELQKATERADALESELNAIKRANSLREIRDKVASEKGIPVALLTGDTEESCIAQAEAILSFAKPTGYPKVKDGGEVQKTRGGSAAEKFDDWFNETIRK